MNGSFFPPPYALIWTPGSKGQNRSLAVFHRKMRRSLQLPLGVLGILGLFLLGGEARDWKTFAFVGHVPPATWLQFDWDKLTTVTVVGAWNHTDLVEHAHRHGTKVVKIGNLAKPQLTNETAIHEWCHRQLSLVRQLNLDGINVDFEDDIEPHSAEREGLSTLMEVLSRVFHEANPKYEVSIDVAWSADCIDGRCYDYARLAQHADLIFVMAYDQQSQMRGDTRCQAKANSPLSQTGWGLKTFLNLGIPREKVILGIPWYGYLYRCQFLLSDTCVIDIKPFRGCPCSDAAGRQFRYQDLMREAHQHASHFKWDSWTQSPFFNFYANQSWHQGWFDDPWSLQLKYRLALNLGLAGVGMWSAGDLDYSNSTQVQAWWQALP